MKKYLQGCLLMLLATSCGDYEAPVQKTQLVVEGMAEADRPPIVYLTATVPVQVGFQSLNNLEDYVLRYAKVTVSDGEESVILTAKVNRNHRIPFEYTTGRMICQAGHTYTLTVDYQDFHAHATAYVPTPCTLDTLYTERGTDGSYHIIAIPSVQNAPRWGRCFIHSSVTYGDFLLAPLSMLPADKLELNNPEIQGQGNYSLRPGEEVIVRCSSLDSIGNRFWADYEQSLYLSRNFLMPLTENLYSNVEGALGYWLGYGSSYYKITID